MEFDFSGQIFQWTGPAPWYFVRVPPEESDDLRETASRASYGWGVIPVSVRVGKTEWTTSLFPKDGCYLLPVKAGVRKAERLEDGQTIAVQMSVEFRDER